MTTALKPYPAYKDSGVPWLGEIPAHWEIKRVKHLFNERVDKGFPDEPLLAATQTKGVVPKSHYENRTVTAEKDLHLLKLVEAGDFVISLRSFEGGIEYAHYRGIISPAYTVLEPRSMTKRDYFEFLLKSDPFIDGLTLFVTGIREGQNIDYARLERSGFPLPPQKEQAFIGQFLRVRLNQINRFIRAKRRLIELLNEQKQAIIHQAVTRGIDPDVPLKPSGVDWLGDIPAHWEVVNSKRHFSASKELARPEDVQLSSTQAFGVIAQARYEELIGRRVVKISMHLEKRRHVEVDDFVISMRSFEGGLERAWDAGAIRSSYVVLRPSNKVDVDFFTYLFKSSGYIRALQTTAGFIRDGQDLTYSDFSKIDVPLPPIVEQTKIAANIAEGLDAIETAQARISREIALVLEYRTRLIADVVTGKLDVRGVSTSVSSGLTTDLGKLLEIELANSVDDGLVASDENEDEGLSDN